MCRLQRVLVVCANLSTEWSGPERNAESEQSSLTCVTAPRFGFHSNQSISTKTSFPPPFFLNLVSDFLPKHVMHHAVAHWKDLKPLQQSFHRGLVVGRVQLLVRKKGEGERMRDRDRKKKGAGCNEK
jgi:hypothetical protein